MDEENHWYPITSDRFKMSVEALLNLVKLNGLINDEICGDGGPSVLLSLLELPQNNDVSLILLLEYLNILF